MGREKGERELREKEETEEGESRGQRQVKWVCGIEKCPVDGHAGKRSKCFVLKVESRSRSSEGRQHPWWESGGKTITHTVSLTVAQPLEPEASHAPDRKHPICLLNLQQTKMMFFNFKKNR